MRKYVALGIAASLVIALSIVPLAVSKPEDDSTEIILAAVGDTLMDTLIQQSAQKLMDPSIEDPDFRVASGFEALFKEIEPFLSSADLTIANLETPLARNLGDKRYVEDGRPMCGEKEIDPYVLYDGEVYSGSLPFNTHPAFALALKNLGFDIVSTAMNHAADRGSNGIDKTIDALRSAELDYVGTLRYDEIVDEGGDGYPDNVPYVIEDVKGIRIAFFAITSLLNGFLGAMASPDIYHQVYSVISSPVNILNPTLIMPWDLIEVNLGHYFEWIEKARSDPTIDLIVVSLHAGDECVHLTTTYQRLLAHSLLEAGADVILGTHPHVLQPIEWYKAEDSRDCFIIYSLGNFIGSMAAIEIPVIGELEQRSKSTQSSIILYLHITKDSDGTRVSGMDYIPTYSYGYEDPEIGLIYKVVPIEAYPELSPAKELTDKALFGGFRDLARATFESICEGPLTLELILADLVWEALVIILILPYVWPYVEKTS